jgi:hypothetical protein
MSNSRHLYFVQSPLQAINAYEARCAIADGADRHEIVVFDQKDQRNNLLLANTLNALGWQPFYRVPFRRSDPLKIVEWLKLRARLSPLRGVTRCYVGDYCAGMAVAALNLFPKAEPYVVDDGTSTINFPGLRYEGRRPEHLPPNRNLSLLGYRTDLPDALTLFSMYEIALRSPDSLRKNHLSFLAGSVEFDADGPVFFIGSCLPDVEVITFDQFFELFRAAKTWLGAREIHYFPHRRELMDRKKAFFEGLGVKLATSSLPFELELTHGSRRPCLVATFYSTALDTLRLLVPERRGCLAAFEVPQGWVQTDSHKEIAAASYKKYHRSEEIQVVSLAESAAGEGAVRYR